VRDISVANDSDLKAREGNISIWTLNKYRLKIESKDNKNILNNSSHISDITISENDFDVLKSKILVYSDEWDEIYIDLVWTKISTGAQLKYQPQNTTHNIEFETRINTKTWITLPSSINDIKPWLQIDKATISYTLDDREVKYYLSPENLWIANGDKIGLNSKVEITTINPLPITKTNLQEFLWVRVIWWIQGWWNSEFTGQKQNISSIASLESRTQIRKNAYTYTNSMTDWQIVNWVKYVDLSLKPAWSKNYKIEENPTYETLVVKNGNVIIDWDLNKNNKVLWIIVLRDGFNVQEDYKTTWNVYVLPNVQKINAIIYADGGLISIKEIKNDQAVLYETDSTERTQNLNKQLYMNGSLFTRNTIWWAVLTNQTNGEYTLPWWWKTTDFNLALQYDLNYTRRWKKWCEQKIEAGKQVCVYNEPFIIKYDSRIQTTPPKLFGN
jgi:hypothetical protein